ncbi:hypothetical protein [Kangiella spongicola]|jgi:hypothetical protein|uniref:hypothetical protein n=1 Tax=Kangiella spongicola TaxID=796379 RepID=UPI00147442DE|nr:hypothetical protein [Kangiella spongicola]
MFESIAMICYLSITEPQNIEQPLFGPNESAHEIYTGSNGGEPEEDPDKTKRD